MDVGSNGRLRFDDFEFDSLSGKLFRDGRPVKIQPQPLRVLGVLLERAGEIVPREQLRTRVWGEATFVEFDQGLNYCIRQIRLALRDGASEPLYIETLPKQGYRFIARVALAPGVSEPDGANQAGAQPAGQSQDAVQANVPPDRVVLSPVPVARKSSALYLTAGILAVLALGVAVYLSYRVHPGRVKYTQLTDFTDSAVAPTLSPDGRMVAFFRGSTSFQTADQVYVKMLPNGEARRLTDDSRLKYNLAFSPDGAEVAYTVLHLPNWSTYTVSVLGGDSHLFMNNAAGLSWLDQHQLLFSRTRTGQHMGRYRNRDQPGISRTIFSTTRTGYGALLLALARSQIGFGGRDEWNRRLDTLPDYFPGRHLRRRADRSRRSLQIRWLVSGWVLDVFHGLA